MLKARFGLEGKRMIILGGGFGMGEATAKLLADLGCNVAILDIIPERAERVAADIKAKGVRSLPLICDVTDDDALIAALDRRDVLHALLGRTADGEMGHGSSPQSAVYFSCGA